MQNPPFWLCLWPGLPRLWLRGQWSALMMAVGFGVLLNLALVSTFVWPEFLGSTFPAVAWSLAGIIWLASIWLGRRAAMEIGRECQSPPGAAQDTLFIQAQSEYLKGNWKQAEALLARQLNKYRRDVEARLLLSTLLRHTGRVERARRELDVLSRLEGSRRWAMEIQRERELLQQLQADDSDEEDNGRAGEDATGVNQQDAVSPPALVSSVPLEQPGEASQLPRRAA